MRLNVLDRAAVAQTELQPLRARVANLVRRKAASDLLFPFADHFIWVRHGRCYLLRLRLRLRLILPDRRGSNSQRRNECKTHHLSHD